MSILTADELKSCKEEARDRDIRQNVKSHCTKIRDGIRNNGSTSGNRAIWELFQNAGDLAPVAAEIKITIKNDAFIFAHKGKPFTFDSLCSLVKQVSSQEKECDDTVGQYGTGFLTTHKFSRKITINGSMLISDSPLAYVDVKDFLINRENFDDIPQFIEDMKNQVKAVQDLMDAEQSSNCKEWTSLSYELNPERLIVAQMAIDEAVKIMPYVLTFNDNIYSCTIEDNTRFKTISFVKEKFDTPNEELLCKRIVIEENGKVKDFFCYYLELDDGKSRIILPLKTETIVCALGDVPRLFVHYPLIGQNNFGVNFIFHSHLFTPEEQRNNIIVPKGNDATEKAAKENLRVLTRMTEYLWKYLDAHIESWTNTIMMAAVNIKVEGYTEEQTAEYYKRLKEQWVSTFLRLKLIDVDGVRYSMTEENHPLVLEPSMEGFLSEEKNRRCLGILYSYAKGAGKIPAMDELIQWSRIIAGWDEENTANFLSLEAIVEYVSNNKGEHLHDMLELIVSTGHLEYFDKYALIPNRENILMKRDSLRDARSIIQELYDLVRPLDAAICDKMVHTDYADIITLTMYTRQNLREELNAIVSKKQDECWKNASGPKPFSGGFEKSLIKLCSSFSTHNGTSKRNVLMPIIARFENLEYSEVFIPACSDDSPSFDLYRHIFISLVENQMMKIEKRDRSWVLENMNDLVAFVDTARGDDYKAFATRYAIYPDMLGELHTPEDLKKNCGVNEKLFELYEKVMGKSLKSKCVNPSFMTFCDKYADDDYIFTPEKVAKDIQNKLSDDKYSDIILLDIIELTEKDNQEGLQWRILFKGIYDLKESIRYNLGTDSERKAINRMMKQKNPSLLETLAEVAENENADFVIDNFRMVINQLEHDAYIKMLGAFVECHIQEFLTDALCGFCISVRNEQCGQDLIISKDGCDDYYVEIKSRWKNKEPVIMSSTQFHNAVANSERYALISVQMWSFDQQRVKDGEHIDLSEMNRYIRVCDKIGILESDLEKRVDEAFKYTDSDISAVGSYEVHVPQKVFDKDFNDLIQLIKEHFGI